MIKSPILVGGGKNSYTTTKTTVSIDSNTSITANVYAQTGDIILATIMYRDINDMIAPSGWTLLFNSNATAVDSNLYHRLGFFKKNITQDGDINVTFTQTNKNRMLLNLITIKNANDIIYKSEYTQYTNKEPTNRFVDIPNKFNSNTKLIWGMTAAYWNTTSIPNGSWQMSPLDIEMYQINDYITQPRLCNIIDLGNGSINRSVKPSPIAADLLAFVIAAVEIL